MLLCEEKEGGREERRERREEKTRGGREGGGEESKLCTFQQQRGAVQACASGAVVQFLGMSSVGGSVLPADVPLADDVRSSLRLMGSLDYPLTTLPLCISRALANLAWLKPYLLGPAAPLERVWDERHPFGTLRFFQPAGPCSAVLLYLHGGGYVMCSLASHDPLCRFLAHRTSTLVVSLDYRLAPEHAIPAPQEDVLAAYRHLLSRAPSLAVTGDAGRALVGVGGDSAGGNLAASLCLALASGALGSEPPPFPSGARVAPLEVLSSTPQPAFQLLIYPATDLTLSSSTPSHARYGGGGWMLSARLRDFFWRHYLGPAGEAREALKRHPLVSPSRGSPEALALVCPAIVLTAEHDILHDEGVAFAQLLQRCGARAEHLEARGLYHGFATSTEIKSGAAALTDMCQRLVLLIQTL